MILILTENDLTHAAEDLPIDEVKITDIANSFDPIMRSSLVILSIGPSIRVLKDKYVTREDDALYYRSAMKNIVDDHLDRLTKL